MSKNEKNVSVRGLSHVFKNFCTWLNSQLSLVAKSGDYNDLINKPDLPQLDDYGSLHVKRDTDGNFFLFTHNSWSTSPVDAWGGMYFEMSNGKNVFGFAARQTTFSLEKFTKGNNGYLRGYDTNGSRSVTLVINGGTAGQPDTQNITIDGTFVNAGNQRPFEKNSYTIGTPDMPYQAMYAGTFNTNSLSNDSGLIASNSRTEHSLLFGIGGTGINRGIYDNKNSRWSIYLNATDYIMTQCPTPPKGDSSNKLATTEWVQTELDSKANKTELASKANDSAVVHNTGDETIAGTKTFSSNIVGNVTGNASTATTATTATKLATARTIALSGAVTGTATGFDGSGNITIPVTALSPSAIRAQWYAAYPDGPEAHNAMWGGRDITAAFDAGTVSANIANGTFKDIFPGDYITKQVTIPKVLADDGTTVLHAGGTHNINWVIADCDYWINKGDNPSMPTHHVAIVPQASIFKARMNSANTTEGGYAGSEMYKKIIPACATGIVNAFGSSHILTFRDCLTQDLNTSAVSSGITIYTGAPNWKGAWYSQQCNLMSEAMVYDGPHCASSALDNIMATRQMSAFRLSERLINYNRGTWWLMDIASSAYFALFDGIGGADANAASNMYGVRPFALLV